MICKNCGNDNVAEALFCENCGSKLEAEAPVAAPAPTPVAAPAPESYVPPAAPAIPVSAPKKKGKGKLILIIAIIVVLLAGIGVVGWFGFCAEYPWFVDESIIGLGGGEAAPAPVEEKEDEKDKEEDKEEEEDTTAEDEKAIEKAVKYLEEGMNDRSSKTVVKAFPEQLQELEEFEEFYTGVIENNEEEYGDDFSCKVIIDEKEQCDDLEEAEEAYKIFMEEMYSQLDVDYSEDDEVVIEDAYWITLKVEIEGENTEDDYSETSKICACKIDGEWYIIFDE